MARVTNTRQRVREIAEQIHAEGGEPTPSMVRSLLGKGSPNTIVEELRLWRQTKLGSSAKATDASQISSPKVLERVGLAEVAHALEGSRSLLEQQFQAFEGVVGLKLELSAALGEVRQNVAQISSLMESFIRDHGAVAQTLVKIQDRFDGVQRHMMRSVEDAREETRNWKERARAAESELVTWRTSNQAKIEALLTQNGELRGKLESR